MKIDSNVLAKFQMLGSRIVSLYLKNDSISSSVIFLGKKNLDISHEIVSVELQENAFLGVIRLHVNVKVKQEKTSYILKLVLEGGFSAPKEMSEEVFKKMLSINGITSLYGIARAHICSISSQSFTDGSVILPMIDVTRYSKVLSSDDSKV